MASRNRRSGTATKTDAYQAVTDKIIAALEQDIVPWHKPWKTSKNGNAPMSLSTKKAYRGVNVFTLGIEAMLRGYDSRWWGTYKQISERGGQVRRGEKGSTVVFWRMFDYIEEGEKKTRPVLKSFTVFNVSQCDGIDDPDPAIVEVEHDETSAHVECELIVGRYRTHGGTGLGLDHGGHEAFYDGATDEIRMPDRGRFETLDHYYGALFHECAHSTGHKSRLNRKAGLGSSFGSPDYSKEELLAEMTTAFVCGEAGIDVNVPHRAGYIANWLQALNDDKKMVVGAAGGAQKAADLILGRDPAAEANDETKEVAHA